MPKGLRKGSACLTCGKPLGTRNKLGFCIDCRTDTLRAAALSHDPIRPHMAGKVEYYRRRAALGMPLFDRSPWRRLPGAHNRLDEVRTERAGATRRIAPTNQIE